MNANAETLVRRNNPLLHAIVSLGHPMIRTVFALASIALALSLCAPSASLNTEAAELPPDQWQVPAAAKGPGFPAESAS